MNQYIKDLSEVIRNTKMTNTYKMVWIRSIVDVCCDDPTIKEIHFDQLSSKIFGYYWNQTFFFDLKQDSLENSKIQQLVRTEIKRYKEKKSDPSPKWFTEIEDEISIPISEVSTQLKRYAAHLFPKVSGRMYDLYQLDLSNRTLTPNHPKLIKDHSQILIDLINYRWTQKLEEFNNSPRISQKVRCIENKKIPRTSLKKFEKYLDLENPDQICFIGNEKMKTKSIDHVIPWSFMYSNDLWNLAYVDLSQNSSKGRKPPHEKIIKKLQRRNEKLYKILKSSGRYDDDVNVQELKTSNEKDWVNKYWHQFR